MGRRLRCRFAPPRCTARLSLAWRRTGGTRRASSTTGRSTSRWRGRGSCSRGRGSSWTTSAGRRGFASPPPWARGADPSSSRLSSRASRASAPSRRTASTARTTRTPSSSARAARARERAPCRPSSARIPRACPDACPLRGRRRRSRFRLRFSSSSSSTARWPSSSCRRVRGCPTWTSRPCAGTSRERLGRLSLPPSRASRLTARRFRRVPSRLSRSGWATWSRFVAAHSGDRPRVRRPRGRS
mmetsp:Transcript_10138/g.41010  ORF Transcript_10138/g.41010 Transcript_10138/m.41010 type:complete len:243 (-) Transcript_10138:289-1017(-)